MGGKLWLKKSRDASCPPAVRQFAPLPWIGNRKVRHLLHVGAGHATSLTPDGLFARLKGVRVAVRRARLLRTSILTERAEKAAREEVSRLISHHGLPAHHHRNACLEAHLAQLEAFATVEHHQLEAVARGAAAATREHTRTSVSWWDGA